MRARRLPEPVHAVAVIHLVSFHADSADGAAQLPGLASGAATRNRLFRKALAGPDLAGSRKVRIWRKFRTARLSKKTFPCFFGVLCAHGRPPGGGAASSSAPALIAPGTFPAVRAGIRGRTGRWHSCTDRESAPERVRERRKRSWAGLWSGRRCRPPALPTPCPARVPRPGEAPDAAPCSAGQVPALRPGLTRRPCRAAVPQPHALHLVRPPSASGPGSAQGSRRSVTAVMPKLRFEGAAPLSASLRASLGRR